jgi:hypothetical protein
MESPETVASRRGKKLEEISWAKKRHWRLN